MAAEKVTYADYVKPKRYIEWTSPIWQERVYIATENAIADAYDTLLETIVELADDWRYRDFDERSGKLPSLANVCEFIDDAIDEEGAGLSPPVLRRVKQELRHDLLNTYAGDVWQAYATQIGTDEEDDASLHYGF